MAPGAWVRGRPCLLQGKQRNHFQRMARGMITIITISTSVNSYLVFEAT